MVTCLNLTRIGPRVAVALLLAGFMAASPVRAADKPASAIDLATLPERAARNYPGSQEPFEQILKLRETGGATAVPALTQVMAADVLTGRIHGYAASQALFHIGTPAAHQALAKYLLDPRYRASEGIDYAFHWNMAEPARSRFIDQYHLVNLAKDLALEVASRVPAGEKDRLEFIVTVTNLADQPVQLVKDPVYLAGLLHFRTADGRFIRSQQTLVYKLGPPTWLTLAPGATHTYTITARLITENGLALDAGDIRFDLGKPGKFTVVAMLEAPPRTPEQLAAAKIADAWSGRAVSKPIEVRLPPDGKAAERAAQLKANLDQFRLSLWALGAWDGKHVNLTLTVPVDAPADHSPLEDAGPQREHETRTVVRISKEQAAKIIEHLAAEGFLGRADRVGRIDRRLAGPAVTFNVYDGPGPQRYFELIGWRPELLQRLDALRQVLDGEAGKALDGLLKAFASLRPQWQPRVSNAPVASGTAWQVMATNALAVAAVERVLYERANDPHFFIRVRITNTTDRPIGVDLRDYRQVIYPNQWGINQESQRGVIDERRVPPTPLPAKLTEDFVAGKLTGIAPGEAVDYYREFNASGRKEIEAQAQKDAVKYLVVSLDGAVPVTDGKAVETLSCVWDGGRNTGNTDLVVPLPVRWNAIPGGVQVVSEQWVKPPEQTNSAAQVLAPFYRNGWHGWPVGTEMRVTFLDDKVEGWYSYVQPDLVYRFTETALTRTQLVDGKPVVQQLDPANETGWQPSYLHKLQTAKTTPITIEIDGVKIDCLLYESTMDEIGRDAGGTTVLKEWVLAAHPSTWLRTEVNKNYKVIKSLRAMRQVGDR